MEIKDEEVHAYKAAYSKFLDNEISLYAKGVRPSLDPSFEATRYALGVVAECRKAKEK